jgi:nucleotide-binding universal stress UspA family protein
MMNDTTILVPLDGSKSAEWALPTAIEMALKLNGKINLVSVSHNRRNGRKRRVSTVSAEELNRTDSERSDYLDAVAKEIETTSEVPAFSTVLFGSAAKSLVKYSTVHHPELLVMSTHGRGPFSRAWLGSVADWVVRHASMPVLLVRPNDGAEVDLADRHGINKVLVALDGSRQAEESLGWAKAIGGEKAAYTLVRVARNSVPVWSVEPTCTSSDLKDYTMIGHIEASEYLSRVERLLNDGRRQVTSVAVDGGPVAVGILETAEENDAEMIAITTHGRGGLPRLILGSVTDKVVRASRIPVLVVRPRRK